MRIRHTVTVNPRLRTLRQIAELDSRDMQAMTNEADKVFRAAESKLFATQGASGRDGKWPALSPDYAIQKRRQFPGRKIMQRSGQLRRSLVAKDAPDHVAQYTLRPATISLGTRDPTAAYHIQGSPLKHPRLPHRDTLAISQADETAMFTAVREYMTKKLERVARVIAAASAAMGGRRAG